eukprot:1155594-Pelagomonas_calceolata.AAC.1
MDGLQRSRHPVPLQTLPHLLHAGRNVMHELCRPQLQPITSASAYCIDDCCSIVRKMQLQLITSASVYRTDGSCSVMHRPQLQPFARAFLTCHVCRRSDCFKPAGFGELFLDPAGIKSPFEDPRQMSSYPEADGCSSCTPPCHPLLAHALAGAGCGEACGPLMLILIAVLAVIGLAVSIPAAISFLYEKVDQAAGKTVEMVSCSKP